MSKLDIARIDLKEHYRDYQPHASSKKSVERLIANTPADQLAGLKTIVLTNFDALNHDRRRGKTRSRKKKVAFKNCRGLYHQKWKGEPAWIELFLDNMFPQDMPKVLMYIPLIVDLVVADTLFHEIGHHVHYTHAPEYKEREDVADKWKVKLSAHYFRKEYWYAVPLLKVVAWGYGLFKKTRRKSK